MSTETNESKRKWGKKCITRQSLRLGERCWHWALMENVCVSRTTSMCSISHQLRVRRHWPDEKCSSVQILPLSSRVSAPTLSNPALQHSHSVSLLSLRISSCTTYIMPVHKNHWIHSQTLTHKRWVVHAHTARTPKNQTKTNGRFECLYANMCLVSGA